MICLNVVSVNAATVRDLQQKRETLSREIQRNKQEAEKKKKEAQKISIEIQKIDGDIKTTEGRIHQTEETIKGTLADIAKVTENITVRENELAVEMGNQREAIRTIYETTERNPIFAIMGDNINEAVDRAAYLESLEIRIESTIDLVTELRDQLVGEKQDLTDRQKELESLKKQQEAYQKGLEQQKSRKNQLLIDAKEALADSQKRLEEARNAYQDVNSELFRITQAARKKAASGSKRVGNITFGWPFTGTITTTFGEPTPIQSFHTGLDVDGVIGDPIIAAADGTVTSAGGNSKYGYGLYITIDHGNGISTLYGHLSGFDVEVGDNVKLGNRIGFMGNTGFAIAFSSGDGSHLHFEVREDGIPVNPGLYLP